MWIWVFECVNLNIENFGMHHLFQTFELMSSETKCVSMPMQYITKLCIVHDMHGGWGWGGVTQYMLNHI